MTGEYADNGATSAEYAMNEVLKAEEDARQSVANCAKDATIILQEARLAAKRIVERADGRITSIHRRSSRAVAATVSQLEREQRLKLSKFDSAAVDMHAIAAVVEQIAELLTTVDPKDVLTRPVD
jgi:vacuolar-type H+-ATPase subunit H